jgi:hypothetical protein
MAIVIPMRVSWVAPRIVPMNVLQARYRTVIKSVFPTRWVMALAMQLYFAHSLKMTRTIVVIRVMAKMMRVCVRYSVFVVSRLNIRHRDVQIWNVKQPYAPRTASVAQPVGTGCAPVQLSSYVLFV